MTEDQIAWLAEEFSRCSGWIQAALDRDIGTHDLEDLWTDIERGAAQLWPLPNGVIVTVVEEYPKLKLLRFWLAGGDLGELVEHEKIIANVFREKEGCSFASFIGRRGFLRTLPGYDEVYAVGVRRL